MVERTPVPILNKSVICAAGPGLGAAAAARAANGRSGTQAARRTPMLAKRRKALATSCQT
jgi:hypothetical protein